MVVPLYSAFDSINILHNCAVFLTFSPVLYAESLQVGIPVFVTGGIGGVHRHGEQSKIHLCTYLGTSFFFFFFSLWHPYGEQIKIFCVYAIERRGEGCVREDTFRYKLEREQMIDTKIHVTNKIKSEIWRRTNK